MTSATRSRPAKRSLSRRARAAASRQETSASPTSPVTGAAPGCGPRTRRARSEADYHAGGHTGMDFTGKVALVTGGGQHIGLTTARLLASLGAAVAINDIRAERAQAAADALVAEGKRALTVPADVRDRGAVTAMVQRTVDTLGGLDVVVNSAGEGSFAPVLEMDEAAWDLELDTNLKGTFLVCQAAARAMV